jgi:uncharacterized Zn-binding protein involved in type VI secretion
MPAIVRVGDNSTGDPCGASPRPLKVGSTKFKVNGKAVGLVGDAWELHACPGSPPHSANISSGSSKFFVEGKPVGLVGSSISCGSAIAKGSPNFNVGS